MTLASRHSLSLWKFRHSVVVWIGILLNLCFALPMLFVPLWLFGIFDIPTGPSLVWPRFAGGLLILLSVFYLPMTLDLDRYRVFAWLAVFPSRSFGVVFFLSAVLIFGQPDALIFGVLIDGSIATASLWCLMRIVRIEQEIGAQRGAS